MEALSNSGMRAEESGSAGSRGFARKVGLAVAAATMLAAGSGTAHAFGAAVPCSTRAESKVFQPVDGDQFDYFLMPNGGFESGAGEWQLQGGATVVSGNNTVFKSGSKSLRIPNGAQVESRTICITKGEEGIRLLVNHPGVGGAILHVQVVIRNTDNGWESVQAFDVNGDPKIKGWRATPRMGVPAMWGNNGTQQLTFKFSTRGTAATWGIDDVYVDPFRAR
jgi:hypothetical protein